MHSFIHSLISTLDVVQRSATYSGHTQVKGHYHPLNRRLGGPPQPMWTFWRIEFLVLAEDVTPDHILLFIEKKLVG